MASTRFSQQHVIELNEKPASSVLMNKEFQNVYKGANELDDEANIHRAKQANPTLSDTAAEKHVTNAQAKKWEDTSDAFAGTSSSSFVAATEVVTSATANKILKLDANGKLPSDITGDAATLNGKADTAFQEVSQKDQPGGYAGLDADGHILESALPAISELSPFTITARDSQGEPTAYILNGREYTVARDAGGRLTQIQSGLTSYILQYDEIGNLMGGAYA